MVLRFADLTSMCDTIVPMDTPENQRKVRQIVQKVFFGYTGLMNDDIEPYVLLQSDLRKGDIKYANDKFGNDTGKVYVEIICDNGGLYLVREFSGGQIYGIIGLNYCCDEEYSKMVSNITKTHRKMQNAGETYYSSQE